jgi:hypothetical protein
MAAAAVVLDPDEDDRIDYLSLRIIDASVFDYELASADGKRKRLSAV